jgi:hypothetical protein
MRRTMHLSKMVLCAAALLVLGACHGGGGGGTRTYVNQKNPAETLKLERQRSVYNHISNLLKDDLKLDGGVYTLTTADGTVKGKYFFSSRSNAKEKLSYIFRPDTGKEWGVVIEADGSFKDARGVWKEEVKKPEAVVDVKAPALVKVAN